MRMMKCAVAGLLVALSAVAGADELAAAQKLWDQKQYEQAFAAFSKLAASGNTAAQVQLGEMYSYGEGTAQDDAKAEQWLAKAVAAGDKEAAGSLQLARQRAARKAEIAFFSTSFDGGNARFEKFGCTRPQIPAVSSTSADIAAVNQKITDYFSCFQRFSGNLEKLMPATNTIPPAVVQVMSQSEFDKANILIGNTYKGIFAEAEKSLQGVNGEAEAWKTATEKLAKETNGTSDANTAYTKILMDRDERVRREIMEQHNRGRVN